MSNGEDEPRARDLLPPDGPAPVDPRRVIPADASLEPPVETRKIGIRRVAGLDFGAHILERVRWRPAGNSRAFWRNIEADDPFLRRPARPTDAVLEIYPAQRLPRVEGSLPKPQPEIAKAYRPRPAAEQERPPRPKKEVKRQRRPEARAPEPRHTPEPRPAPTPRPTPQPEAPQSPVQRDTPTDPTPRETPEPPAPLPQPPPRRLPPKPPAGQTRVGRQRIPSRVNPQKPPPRKKSAKEIREEKLRARKGETKEKPRSIDEYREFMQRILFLQEKYEKGEELPEIIDETAAKKEHRPKPKREIKRGQKPKREVKRPKARTPTPQKPAQKLASQQPEPSAPVDRRPPMPKPKKAEEPVDRSLRPQGNAAGLDDLFGGGGDRVRIGRRTRPKPPGEDEN